LLLDTKGWTGGFVGAQKAASGFSSAMATSVAGAVTKAGLRLFTMEKMLRAVKVAATSTAKAFTDIEKSFGLENKAGEIILAEAATRNLGLALSKVDAFTVVEANRAFREMGAVLSGIHKQFVVDIAPAVTSFIHNWLIGFESMKNSIDKLGSGLGGLTDNIDAMSAFLANPFASREDYLGTIQSLRDQRADAIKNRRQAVPLTPPVVPDKGLTPKLGTSAASAAAAAVGITSNILAHLRTSHFRLFQQRSSDLLSIAGRGVGGIFGNIVNGIAAPKAIKPSAIGFQGNGTQEALERGSLGAVQAVQAMGGDAIRSVDENTALMLKELKSVNVNLKGQKKIVQARI
jgi:hypothetical protein